MTAVTGMELRRALYAPPLGEIVEQVIHGSESLHAIVSDWRAGNLRESQIVGAQRSLIGLQNLLIGLSRHVPILGRRDD